MYYLIPCVKIQSGDVVNEFFFTISYTSFVIQKKKKKERKTSLLMVD